MHLCINTLPFYNHKYVDKEMIKWNSKKDYACSLLCRFLPVCDMWNIFLWLNKIIKKKTSGWRADDALVCDWEFISLVETNNKKLQVVVRTTLLQVIIKEMYIFDKIINFKTTAGFRADYTPLCDLQMIKIYDNRVKI